MSQFREMMSQEEVEHEDAPEPTTATTSTERPCQSKKKESARFEMRRERLEPISR